MEKREEVVRRTGEAQQGSMGEEKRGKQRGKAERDEGAKKWKKTEGEHLPTELNRSLSSARVAAGRLGLFIARPPQTPRLLFR